MTIAKVSIHTRSLTGIVRPGCEQYIKQYFDRHRLTTDRYFSRSRDSRFGYIQTCKPREDVTVQLFERYSKLRIEYSAEDPVELELFSKYADGVRLTRLDIAIDYNLGLEHFLAMPISRKTYVAYLGSNGTLETILLGGARCLVSYRLYDRNAKQGLARKEPTTRIEVQVNCSKSGIDPLSPDLFGDLAFVPQLRCQANGKLSVIDEALLYYLRLNPQGWKRLTRGRRTNLKKFCNDAKARLPEHPHDVYMRSRDWLTGQVSALLAKCSPLAAPPQALTA